MAVGPRGDRRVHMANERTFLAWIRTSIGLMAFGFVVEKFALFVRQISLLVERSEPSSAGKAALHEAVTLPQSPGYSTWLGIMLVGLGALMGLLSFIRYKKIERQIEDDTYKPSFLLDMMLAIAVLSVGIFLVIYLVHSL